MLEFRLSKSAIRKVERRKRKGPKISNQKLILLIPEFPTKGRKVEGYWIVPSKSRSSEFQVLKEEVQKVESRMS